MPALPVIPAVKRVSPAHAITHRIAAGLDLGAVVLVVDGALVDAFVEAFNYTLHRGGHAIDIEVRIVAELAELVGCAAVGYGVEGVVGGGAVAEECGLRAVCWTGDGGCADCLS